MKEDHDDLYGDPAMKREVQEARRNTVGARITRKHTQKELEEFDALPFQQRVNIYLDLGSVDFIAAYGEDRVPKMPSKPNPGVRGEFADEDKPTDWERSQQHKVPPVDMRYPDGNPKTQFGIAKPDTFAVDPLPMYVMGMAMLQGMLKYGLYNYIEDPISISTYLEAIGRHRDLYKLGQELASDTDVEHLGHIMACCSILISAKYHGTLIDDRTKNLKMAEDLDKFFQDKQALVKKIRIDWTGFAEKQKALKGTTITPEQSKVNMRGYHEMNGCREYGRIVREGQTSFDVQMDHLEEGMLIAVSRNDFHIQEG